MVLQQGGGIKFGKNGVLVFHIRRLHQRKHQQKTGSAHGRRKCQKIGVVSTRDRAKDGKSKSHAGYLAFFLPSAERIKKFLRITCRKSGTIIVHGQHDG